MRSIHQSQVKICVLEPVVERDEVDPLELVDVAVEVVCELPGVE